MKNYLPSKFSSIWFETYQSGSHPDIQAIEKHSTNFLKTSNDETGPTTVVNHLCNNSFCGFVCSEDGDADEYPQLSLIVHPFKESISGSLNQNEPIFGIKLSADDNGNDVAQIIEIPNPKEVFATLGNPSSPSNENLIYTPTFQELMGKFGEDNSKPLSNATELAPFDPTTASSAESTKFPPTYAPRKFIPLTPIMIAIILKHEPDEISGIINEIRQTAWASVDKLFDSEDDKIDYLNQVYKVVQALWVHGQDQESDRVKKKSDNWKFIRTTPNFFKETKNNWAIEKAKLITGLSASHHDISDDDQSTKSDHSKDEQNEDNNGNDDYGTGHKSKKEKSVHWQPEIIDKLLTKTTKMTETAHNLLAKMVNHEASIKTSESAGTRAQQQFSDVYKPYIALKIASSPDKLSPADEISEDLKMVVDRDKSLARDAIALELNHCRQANMRIDKTMATYMRTFQVFRESPDLPGNISVFHCYPRPYVELSEMMSGEEIDLRVKTKAIAGDIVRGIFETKLAVTTNASDFTRQLYNFWQYVAFQFRDDSWLSKQVKRVWEICRDSEDEIKSIVVIQQDFLLAMVTKINNDFQHTLWSCMKCKGDISKVNWISMEALPAKVQGYINDREKPAIILTNMTRVLLENQNKRRPAIQDQGPGLGDGTPKRPRLGNEREDAGGHHAGGYGDDPNKINSNVRKDWKLSQRDFRRIISPFAGSCPKQDGKPLCAAFLIMGRCGYGSRCQRVHDNLSEDTIQTMTKWIETCKTKAEARENKKKKAKDEADGEQQGNKK